VRAPLATAIFGKVGRIASKEVVLHLVTTKCIPVLLYGLEVCPLTKAELHSFDFAVTRFLTKLFNTSSITVIKDCCRYFGFKLPSELLEIRFRQFMFKRNLWPCTRLFCDTLSTYKIIVSFVFTLCLFFSVCILYMHVVPMFWWIKIDIY